MESVVTALNWFKKNYLCFRKQMTKFNNVNSDTECILFGVPQGSVLYARYLCSRDALGRKADAAARPSARATIGYLVYKDL